MSELAEDIEYINEQLLAEYGREMLASNQQRFRVVFSDDQFEKRWTDKTAEGWELIHPEVRLLPKYRQYIHGRYILERLVPVIQPSDLTEKVSYEPLHVFQTNEKHGHQYLPPKLDMCKFAIDNLLMIAGQKRSGHAKYIDPATKPEYRSEMLKDMERNLFGNETAIGDALAHDYGVTVQAEPHNFEKTVVETTKNE